MPEQVPEPRVFVPQCWIAGKNDIMIIRYICEHHFTRMFDFALNSMAEQLSEVEVKQLNKVKNQYERHNQKKRLKSDLVFFTEDSFIIDRIDDFIDQNGGWRDIQRIIDLPQNQIGVFNLPYVEGDIVIDSIGEGDFFTLNGFLVRVGLSTTVRYGKTRYQCYVEAKDKFVVKRGNKHVYEGQTPTAAWREADKEFEMKGEDLFGITCHQVIGLYNKLCTEDKRKELGITDYLPPLIITFPSINLAKR